MFKPDIYLIINRYICDTDSISSNDHFQIKCGNVKAL